MPTGVYNSRKRHLAGRPTNLTQELLTEIKELVLEGKNLREIAEIKQIPEPTLYEWHHKNYQNLNILIEGWKRDRMLKTAEGNLQAMMDMEDTNYKQVGEAIIPFKDSSLTRVKLDASKFVAETLGKKNYSKQTETKSLVVNVNIDSSEEMEKMADLLNDSKRNEIYSGTSESSDGVKADVVVTEIQVEE